MMSEPPVPPPYDARFVQGVAYFNECDFFEAHEVWEELWTEVQGPTRKFFQGMIQLAVCLHHFGNGNVRGARKLYHSCRGYLEEYLPHCYGVDLEKLLYELHACCDQILDPDESADDVIIDPDLIPDISLDPPVF